MRSIACILALACLHFQGWAVPMGVRPRQSGPIVTLDYATFQGKTSTSGDQSIDSFLGMPFASPPVATHRLTLPTDPPTYPGVYDATQYGNDCPQQQSAANGIRKNLPSGVLDRFESQPGREAAAGDPEDCLFINVQRPSDATESSALPVLIWIYGGGFEEGGSSAFDGSPIVERSKDSGQPIIFVSMNYRVSGWGFLPGKEVKAAGVGNLGLQDQRFAMNWTNKYIAAFGGDPNKVTIWGQSAGAISVSLQMLTNDGDPAGLYRGAFMNSGSPIAVADIADSNGQAVYDTVAEAAGCADAADSLQCLREVSYETFNQAVDRLPGIFSYQSLKLAYLPRADGVFLSDDPQKLVIAGQYAHVPMVSGDCDDEGTLFSLSQLNITTDEQFKTYMKENYMPEATDEQIETLATLYPEDPAQGSPYGTGDLNALTPQYKRLASVQGDLIFQSTRRLFLNYTAQTQPTWSFLSKRMKDTPNVGSYHGSDLQQYFYDTDEVTREGQDYLINFVNNLDPNVGANPSGLLIDWPQYGQEKEMLLFSDPIVTNPGGTVGLSYTTDDYREEPIAYVTELSLQYPA